jgi:1,4-dihydroxy-2-naphthoate octaprenyltransferase
VIKILAEKASPDALKDVLEFVRSTDDKESQRQYELEGKKETTKRLGIAFIATALIAVLVHAGITKNNDLAEKLLIGTVAGISGVMYGKSQRDKD